MKNNEWKISFKKGKEKNYVDINSVENFEINEGINFIIGKNNAGKTMLLNSLDKGDFVIKKKDNKIDPIILNFKYDSIFINEENRPRSRVSDKHPRAKIGKGAPQEIDISNFFNNFKEKVGENLGTFLADKKLLIKRTYKDEIDAEISGVNLSDSGTGENRILYLIYSMASLGESISSEIKKIRNDNKFILDFIKKISNEMTETELVNLENIFSKKDKFKFNTYKEFDAFTASISRLILLFEENFDKKAAEFLFIKINDELDSGFRIEVVEKRRELNNTNLVDLSSNDLNSFREKWMKHFSLLSTYEIYDDNEFIEIYKRINKTLDIEHLSTDILFLIDEPDTYINSIMYKTLAEAFEAIFMFYKQVGFDIRIIISTHEERMIKELSAFIANVNVFYKVQERIHFKNIFNNNLGGFIESIEKDFDEYFVKKYKGDDKQIRDIKKDMSYLTNDYLSWFITLKDNLRILMSDDVMIVEGYHDKISLESIKGEIGINEIIETDGTYLGMFIWLKIIEYNQKKFNNVSLLIDLDYNSNFRGIKQHTQLMREYLYTKFINIIKVYSSLFNDITEWINYIETPEYYPFNQETTSYHYEKWVKEKDFGKIKLWKWGHLEREYRRLNLSKEDIKSKYTVYDLYKKTNDLSKRLKNTKISSKTIETSFLFNQTKIFRTINDYFNHNIDLTNTKENWIKVYKGDIFIDEYLGYEYKDYIDESTVEQWVKLSLDKEINISEDCIIVNNIDPNNRYVDGGYVFSILDKGNMKLYVIAKNDGLNSIYINKDKELRVIGKLLKTINIERIEINSKFKHIYKIHHDSKQNVITDARIFSIRYGDMTKRNNENKNITYIDPKTKMIFHNKEIDKEFIKNKNIKDLLAWINIRGYLDNMTAFIGPINITMDEFEEEFDFEKTWKILDV